MRRILRYHFIQSPLQLSRGHRHVSSFVLVFIHRFARDVFLLATAFVLLPRLADRISASRSRDSTATATGSSRALRCRCRAGVEKTERNLRRRDHGQF